jgi:hypothetical protein
LFVIVFLAVPTFLIIILSNINRTFKNTGKYRINPAELMKPFLLAFLAFVAFFIYVYFFIFPLRDLHIPF